MCSIAMGLRPEQARASIRFSLGKQTTDADIDFALALVPGDRSPAAGAVADVHEASSQHGEVSQVQVVILSGVFCREASTLCISAGASKLHRFFASLRMTMRDKLGARS